MKRLLISLTFTVVLLLGLQLEPNKTLAAVNPNDVNSVMNGLITQQSINQTKKPQYADRDQTSELIDPASGKLVWRENQISLPGRDGLDLNIGIMYDSNNSSNYVRNYSNQGSLRKYNYLNSRYDLGLGWSFQFPSVQIYEGYYYYHKGDGAVYRINFYSGDSITTYTHLEGYQGKDLRFMQDNSGMFYNGQVRSVYYLEYADKKREYFSADGLLIGIADRFGNSITFQHVDRMSYDGKTYKNISLIKDSIGREISFAYDTLPLENGLTGDRIIVSVKDTSASVKQTVTYMKYRETSYFNNLEDGYTPVLWYVMDQGSEKTYFSYDHRLAKFDYNYKSLVDNRPGSGSNVYKLLNGVTYPSSATIYDYEVVDRNLGYSGIGQEFRVSARYDQFKRFKSGVTTWFGDYNHTDFSYTGDYTGYPTYYDNTPASYTYSSKSTIKSSTPTNRLASTTVFNGVGQVQYTESIAANRERKVSRNKSYHPIYSSLPLVTEMAEYGVGDTDESANKLLVEKQYVEWGGLQSETQPLTPEQFNDPAIKSKYTTTYTYDPAYYFLQTKSWYQNASTLLSESYHYDSAGRIKSYTDPKGEVTSYCYEGLNGTDSCTNPNTAVTGPIVKMKTTKNLGTGKTSIQELYYKEDTKYAYPGEIRDYITTTNTSGEVITQPVINFRQYYMGTGLVREEKDGEGRVTSYEYDPLGRVTRVVQPAFTNLNGVRYSVEDRYSYKHNVYSTLYDKENEGLTSFLVNEKTVYTRKSDGLVTTVSELDSYYDPYGNLRLKSSRNPSNGAWQVTQFHNDDLGRANYMIDPEGNTDSVVFNEWGDQKEAVDEYGNLYVTEYRLKERKNINYFVAADQIATYRADPESKLVKSSYTEQSFDQWGQHISTLAYKEWPSVNKPVTESYTYDIVGNRVTHIDPKKNLNNEGVTTKFVYDPLDRLVSLKDALGQIYNYQYDGNDKVISITVQRNEGDTPKTIRTTSFNEMGSVESKIDAASQKELYNYNALGLLRDRVDRNGSRFTYQYDEQNRTTVTLATGAGITQENRTIIGSNNIRQDTSEIYLNGVKVSSMTTTIDTLKRVNSIDITGEKGYHSVVNLAYDNNDRITKLASGSAFTTHYKFNRSRLDKVQVNGQAAVSDLEAANVKYEYYPDGETKKIQYPPLVDGSIVSTEYTYTPMGEIDTVTNRKGTAILSSFDYEYDDNGNIITITQVGADGKGKTNHYSYDKIDRLTGITRWDGSSASYTYDDQGNRLTLTDTEATNMDVEDTSYTYDLHNTLKSAVKGGVTTSFEYAPNGLRYKKTSDGKATQYYYNTNGKVISELDGNNQVTANYVHGDRPLVKKEVKTGKDYYYLYNGHGDVTQIVDRTGKIVNYYSYDEWGNITEKAEEIHNPFRYSGEIQDEETGLYYLRSRYYDPSVGRFLNEDTYEGQIDNPLSLNLYTYTENNPLLYVDPDGHFAILVKWAVQTAIGVGVDYAISKVTGEKFDLKKSIVSNAKDISGTKVISKTTKLVNGIAGATKASKVSQAASKASSKGTGNAAQAATKNAGRSGKQARLKEIANDDKVSSALRGEIKRDMNEIKQGKRPTIRVPQGYQLAHRRGFEARKGYGYDKSDLQMTKNHKTQHKHDNYGRKR